MSYTQTSATPPDLQAWTDVLGPQIRFATPPGDEEGWCVIRARFPAGVIIPVHSHPDRETLVVLAGEIEGWLDGAWRTVREGETLNIPAERTHALRNASGQDATLVLVTTMQMGRFFRDIGQPVDPGQAATPSPERIATLVAASQRYGYRLGSPADNAAAGLAL